MQFHLYSLRFSLLECHEWSAAPISACLRWSHEATWIAVGGKSIPAPCANFFFALTHRIRARDWIGCKSCFPSLSKTETSCNSFSGAWSTHCATQPVKIFVVLYFLYLRYRNWRNIQCSKCFLCSFLAVTVKSSGERRLLVFRLVRQANPALHRIFGMISYDQGLIQNRRQKVVNRGALRLFGGLYVRARGVDIQIWQKFH